jgi:hypothetical protein
VSKSLPFSRTVQQIKKFLDNIRVCHLINVDYSSWICLLRQLFVNILDRINRDQSFCLCVNILERLYSRMEDEYELKERATTLADKVETVQNTASALTDLIDAQRSYRLEITIVILIAVEIAIAIFDLFFRPRYGL